jgi:dienelactone hydrolase
MRRETEQSLKRRSAFARRARALGACVLCSVASLVQGAALPTLQPIEPITTSLDGTSQLADYGYLERQYFLSGLADTHEPTSMADSLYGHLDRDNAADLAVRPAVIGKKLESDRPYTTRVIVLRPQSAERFSGVVVLEPLHPRGRPSARARLLPYLLAAGHAWVGVENPITFRKLRRERPAAFGSLAAEHPSQIWGMLTQTAQALRTSALLDMPVRRIVMTGYSNSGTVTALYANSFGDRKIDGRYLIDGYLPFASGVYNHPLGVPVIRVMTQSDFAHYGVTANRREDSDLPHNRYRLVEVSGTTHSQTVGDTCALYSMPENAIENDVPLDMVLGQALQNLIAWIDDGVAPPRAPRLGFADGKVIVDEFGHATGGLRLPHVVAPLSSLNASAPGCEMAGFRIPLERSQLRRLYPTPNDFIERRAAVAAELEQQRWISAQDAQRIREEAHRLAAGL